MREEHSIQKYRESKEMRVLLFLSLYAPVWLMKISKCRDCNCLPKPDGESNPGTLLLFDPSFPWAACKSATEGIQRQTKNTNVMLRGRTDR